MVYELLRRPLKVGIHTDILALLPDLPPKELRIALALYTGNVGYLQRVAQGAWRYPREDLPAPAGSARPPPTGRIHAACSCTANSRLAQPRLQRQPAASA